MKATSKTPDKPARPEGWDALPKRFKDLVVGLEAERDALLAVLPTTQKTNVRVRTYRNRGDSDIYLPDGSRVEFTIPSTGKGIPSFEVEVDVHDGAFRVRSVHGMVVIPEVTNSLSIVSRYMLRGA